MDFCNPDGMKDLYKSIYLTEEVDIDENRKMARDPEGRNSGHSKQPDPSKPGFTGTGNMTIDQIRKMSARIKKEKEQNEGIDLYDQMLEFLCVEGYAEDLDDAEWIMANCLIGEDIVEILEGRKEPNFDKMKRQEDRHRTKAVKQKGGSRGSSKNRAMKMSSIRNALERGEDPRADGYGGKRAERGNPPEDHRAAFSKNPLNNPPRPVKKPGV